MLDNATQPCHSPLDTDGDPVSGNAAPCGCRSAAWYVVRTGHNAERFASQEIGLVGDFAVFCPMLRLEAQPARRYSTGAVRPALSVRHIPLFRRYIFVRFDTARDPWRTILRMRGVDGIIYDGAEKPVPVPFHAIDELMRHCDPLGVYEPSCPAQTPIAVGSKVKIRTGALLDHAGIVQLSAGGRVRLLMELLGRPVAVSLPQSDVEPV